MSSELHLELEEFRKDFGAAWKGPAAEVRWPREGKKATSGGAGGWGGTSQTTFCFLRRQEPM